MDPKITEVNTGWVFFFWKTVIEEEGRQMKALRQEMIISLLFKRLRLSD